MTPPTPWHPAEPDLQAFVDGRAAVALATSVEAHLVACHDCRRVVRDGVQAVRLASIRSALDERLDQLERPRLERLLVRLGLAEVDVRALLAAPALRRAWFLAVLGSIALVLLNTQGDDTPDESFLLFAPLLPAVVTAFAYAPGLDPAFTLISATPYRVGRMLLARSLAVGFTAVVGVAVSAVLLPGQDVVAAAWLLPAVAVTVLALALSGPLGSGPAAAGVCGSWAALVAGLHRDGAVVSVVAGPEGQLVSAAVLVVALVALVRQHRSLGGGTVA